MAPSQQGPGSYLNQLWPWRRRLKPLVAVVGGLGGEIVSAGRVRAYVIASSQYCAIRNVRMRVLKFLNIIESLHEYRGPPSVYRPVQNRMEYIASLAIDVGRSRTIHGSRQMPRRIYRDGVLQTSLRDGCVPRTATPAKSGDGKLSRMAWHGMAWHRLACHRP